MGESAVDATWDWITRFIMAPHPQLGRTGEVCPFVKPAIRQQTLVMRERQLGSDADVEAVIAELRDCVREFRDTNLSGNRLLHAMLFLFPGLPEQQALLLDQAHALIKDELVPQDIMMAPCHTRCREPAVRTPEFMVFRSPVPMVAVRRLAIHDVLFLHQKREWFLHYARQYGDHYQRSTGLDQEYVQCYRLGIEAFGDPSATGLRKVEGQQE